MLVVGTERPNEFMRKRPGIGSFAFAIPKEIPGRRSARENSKDAMLYFSAGSGLTRTPSDFQIHLLPLACPISGNRKTCRRQLRTQCARRAPYPSSEGRSSCRNSCLNMHEGLEDAAARTYLSGYLAKRTVRRRFEMVLLQHR